MNEEHSLAYAKAHFEGEALRLVLEQIGNFFHPADSVAWNRYSAGEDVALKKGAFLHGIPDEEEVFDFIAGSGFISMDFTETAAGVNKIKHSVGMWNLKQDCLLREYIRDYSGFTVTVKYGRGASRPTESMLIPYHKFDEVTERINDDEEIYIWWGDKTKEVTYLPSLVAHKPRIGFILNMESDYARKMAQADVWNTELSDDVIEPFLDSRYYPKFLNERLNRDASTTDRESSIFFGLPAALIEGVLVDRRVEGDPERLARIATRLPGRYICNLDGTVIVGNI